MDDAHGYKDHTMMPKAPHRLHNWAIRLEGWMNVPVVRVIVIQGCLIMRAVFEWYF